jgi:hypothetical protein
MLKFFKKSDIVNTDFNVSTDKVANDILSDLIVGIDTSGSIFPINALTFECDDTKSGSCETLSQITNIAYSPSENEINYQLGKKFQDGVIFYEKGDSEYFESLNPVNRDNSYKGNVYNTVKKMYYNDYNNAYNIFGFEGFDTSKANLNLSNDFIAFNLKITDSGDKLKPNSINIRNQSGDIVASIKDDGYNNLYLSGTYFINKSEFTSSFEEGFASFGSCGVSQLINGGGTPPPTKPDDPPPPTFYYYTYESCDTSGSILYVSSSTPITISLKQTLFDSSSNTCYNYFSTGGNGSNGNIDDYTAYSDCATCEGTGPDPYYIFESCDTSGSLLFVWSGSATIPPNLTISTYDEELQVERCYVSKSFGGNGRDGNIDQYTTYVDCDACDTVNPVYNLYHFIFEPCDGIGDNLQIKSLIPSLNTNVIFKYNPTNKCYRYLSEGGDASDGNLENFLITTGCDDPLCISENTGALDEKKPVPEKDCEVSGGCVPPPPPPIPDKIPIIPVDPDCPLYEVDVIVTPVGGYWVGSSVEISVDQILTNTTKINDSENPLAGGYTDCEDVFYISGLYKTLPIESVICGGPNGDEITPIDVNPYYMGTLFITEAVKDMIDEYKLRGRISGISPEAEESIIITLKFNQYTRYDVVDGEKKPSTYCDSTGNIKQNIEQNIKKPTVFRYFSLYNFIQYISINDTTGKLVLKLSDS